jgi:hypothetical protein
MPGDRAVASAPYENGGADRSTRFPGGFIDEANHIL